MVVYSHFGSGSQFQSFSDKLPWHWGDRGWCYQKSLLDMATPVESATAHSVTIHSSERSPK